MAEPYLTLDQYILRNYDSTFDGERGVIDPKEVENFKQFELWMEPHHCRDFYESDGVRRWLELKAPEAIRNWGFESLCSYFESRSQRPTRVMDPSSAGLDEKIRDFEALIREDLGLTDTNERIDEEKLQHFFRKHSFINPFNIQPGKDPLDGLLSRHDMSHTLDSWLNAHAGRPAYFLNVNDILDYYNRTLKKERGQEVIPLQQRVFFVGDQYASLETNDPATVQAARPGIPTNREYFLPVDPGQKMVFKLHFKSVDWLEGTSPHQLERPAQAYLVPLNYKGELPPTQASKQQWFRDQLKTPSDQNALYGLDPSNRLSRSTKLEDLFHDLSPKTTGEYEAELTVKPGAYQLIIRAGERQAPTDRFDNLSVTLTGQNIGVHPEFGRDYRRTIILGEEVYNITRKEKDGTVTPLPVAPETSDSGTYLYSEAYALYHPKARNEANKMCSDTRLFTDLQKGKKYSLKASVRGIDHKGFEVLLKGEPHDKPADPAYEIRSRVRNLKKKIEPLRRVLKEYSLTDQQPYWRPLDSSYRFNPEFGKTTISLWSSQGQRATLTKYAEKGRYFVKLVDFSKKRTIIIELDRSEDLYVNRTELEEWIKHRDASPLLKRYEFFLLAAEELGNRPVSSRGKLNKRFIAPAGRVEFVFKSQGGDGPATLQSKNGYRGVSKGTCDELRFDEIRLEDEEGNLIHPQLVR